MAIRVPKNEWNSAGRPGVVDPGKYLARVATADEKVSNNGNPMIAVMLANAGTGEALCYDNYMLGGGGVGIARAKFKALGYTPTPGEGDGDDVTVVAADLVGLCAYVHLIHGVNPKNGETKMDVDINASKYCGYEPAEAQQTPARSKSNVPF